MLLEKWLSTGDEEESWQGDLQKDEMLGLFEKDFFKITISWATSQNSDSSKGVITENFPHPGEFIVYPLLPHFISAPSDWETLYWTLLLIC